MNGQMNGHLESRVRQQFYLDSVALMRMSRTLSEQAGVNEAAMMMGTPANLEIMSNAGLLDLGSQGADEPDIGAGDLIISVRAASQAEAISALDEAETLLAQPQQVGKSRDWQPRSIRSAVAEHRDANLVLISVPGAFAVSEARKAIQRGLHAMIFSDNVPIDDEAALKREARKLGVLVMGPDCGTCVINGVPLAFANQLPRGDIGIVGASGTGIQEVSCLLASMGKGISHAIGVGGRDMSNVVGGVSTLMALDALDADEATQHVVLICKPPAPEVAAVVLKRIAQSPKRFTVCFIGGQTPQLPDNAQWADTLTSAAEQASGSVVADSATADTPLFDAMLLPNATNEGEGLGAGAVKQGDKADRAITGSLIRGLYCGGTLCAEAQVICLQGGVTVSSNAAIPGVSSELSINGHTLIDLGSDEYTRGKPHPMIDPSVRDQLLAEALADERTAVVLMDLVLGFGAHIDPASQLVNSLPTGFPDAAKPIIVSVTGTEQDPQVRNRQIAILQRSGIQVAVSNAHAASIAVNKILTD